MLTGEGGREVYDREAEEGGSANYFGSKYESNWMQIDYGRLILSLSECFDLVKKTPSWF